MLHHSPLLLVAGVERETNALSNRNASTKRTTTAMSTKPSADPFLPHFFLLELCLVRGIAVF